MEPCKWEGCKDERGRWGSLLPPNEASGLWKQHPPIVASLELGGDGTGTVCGRVGRGGGRGGPCCQTGSSCMERGPPSVVGGGVD